ncbi:uncharacterized protein PAC_12429 [Phialocephala subalpina]|uniref:Extracellular mutant protein 11 C-terminal domain-containing protein n=1 Tax=Phialocephala subalpina TaxID=576137 RepID=A0A1L7XBY5_9HELO|nr:uncharacterized protein PAC_12429 [Phialocephala subalpina]
MATRFIESGGRNRPGSPATGGKGIIPERASAQKFKISTGSKAMASSTSAAKLPSTAPAPGYNSNPSTTRNTFPQPQFYPQQPPSFSRGGLDSSSVASDFDKTITSDLGIELNGGHEFYEDEDMYSQHAEYDSYGQSRHPTPHKHKLHHQSPMVDLKVEQEGQRHLASSISGRFEGQHNKSRSFELRPAEEPASGQLAAQGSRKRSRSRERNGQLNAPSTILEERSSQMDDFDEELRMPEELDVRQPEAEVLQERDEQEEEDFETPSNSPRKNRLAPEPPSSQPGPIIKAAATTPKQKGPDYEDAALQKMSYTQLEKEPWEKVDENRSFQLAKPLKDTSLLADKMEHYVSSQEQDAQVAFFKQMPNHEWEEAGDWFVEQFADLMKKIKNKRVDKRAITKKYEEEISARERLVRGKSDNLDREFRDMRVGGEGILKGKRV